MRSSKTFFSLILTLLLASTVEAAQRQTTRAHYLVFSIDAKENVTLYSDREVTLAGKLKDDRETGTKPREQNKERVVVRVLDASGKQLYQKTLDVDREVRIEKTGPDGKLRGRVVKLDNAAFVARVPLFTDEDIVEIEVEKSRKKNKFPLKRGRKSATAVTNAADSIPAASNFVTTWGPSSNRVDLLILGDGYTSAQENDFNDDAETVADGLFGVSPHYEYENFVNVESAFTASIQSGADHPSCSDPDKISDPLEPSFRNTAFDATYCTGGIQRSLTVDYQKVYDFAGETNPNWDQLIVLVNDPFYGGTGGNVSVIAMNLDAVGTAQHEYGHTFTGLGDEYDEGTPGTCSDASSSYPCPPNVTDVTTRSAIKWNPWILSSTLVPTPETSTYDTVVGLFQGAHYDPTNHYRPQRYCKMLATNQAFCRICRQQYVKALYDPLRGGIDLIEWESHAAGNVYVGPGGTMSLSTDLLSPLHGPALTVEWRVDTALQTGETGESFNYTPPGNGPYTIQLTVKDPTTFVDTTMTDGLLQFTRTWTLNVIDPPPPELYYAYSLGSSVALAWEAVPDATGYEIQVSTNNVDWSHAKTVGAVTSANITSVVPGQAYLYRIATIVGDVLGTNWSAPEFSAVVQLTDESLTSGMRIKAVHLSELRTAINAARAQLTTLGPATYTSTVAPGQKIRASMITEMRTAIAQLLAAVNAPPPTFPTDPTVSSSTKIKVDHVLDLRSAFR